MCFIDGPRQEGCPFLLEAEGRGQKSGRGGRRKWSMRHMSTLRSRSAVGLGDCALVSTPDRREVVDWLNSILRGAFGAFFSSPVFVAIFNRMKIRFLIVLFFSIFEQSNWTFNSPLFCASFGKILPLGAFIQNISSISFCGTRFRFFSGVHSPDLIAIAASRSLDLLMEVKEVELELEPESEEERMRKIGEAMSALDIRVGQLPKARRHEEADSLYVEKVDVGKAEPRIICSGLIKYLPLQELQI